MVKNILPLAIIFLFSFLAGSALLNSGLPPTHDGEYHVVRFYEFDKVLRDGNFYPRWAPDLNYGFGVPLFNYVYPLPNYISSFFHLFGISFIDSFKLNMFAATILGSVFFYLWARQFWGNLGGIVSSVFYTFAPYRFVDIYIRGSVGEVWALAFFPAFLWSITNFINIQKRKYFFLSTLFLALIIFSHNILALMFFVFSISYIVFMLRKIRSRQLIFNIALVITLGLSISSIFWLPAIFESKYVTGLQIYSISENFPDLFQLLIPSWGSGFSGGELQNQMSFQIGIANLFVVFLSIIVLIISIKRKNKHRGLIFFFLAWFVLIFFLMLKVSLPVWDKIPFMNYFQFPWRFLSLEIMISSFLAGSIFIKLEQYKLLAKMIAIILILLAFFINKEYAKPAHYLDRDDNYYLTRSNFIDGTNSPGNFFNTIWINQKQKKEDGKISFIKGNGKIESEDLKSTKYKFIISANQDSEIIINTAYFPGWEVFTDTKKTITQNRDGVISFSISKGQHLVETNFANTDIRSISKFFSITAIAALFFFCWVCPAPESKTKSG